MSGSRTVVCSALVAAGLVSAPFLAPRAAADIDPTVQVTSPTADSTVRGSVTVDALGQTDPSGSDASAAVSPR
jgi:hypothetical protein